MGEDNNEYSNRPRTGQADHRHRRRGRRREAQVRPIALVPDAGQRSRRGMRCGRAGTGLPHRPDRADADGQPGHPHRPGQLQSGAVHVGARMGQRAWHRPARSQHARQAHRRVPDHAVGGHPRGRHLRGGGLPDRHVGRLLPRLARDDRHAGSRRHHELPVAAARGGGALRVLPKRGEHRAGTGDHPHPGLPAHRPRRVGRTVQPGIRRRRKDVRRQRHARSSRGTCCRSCCRPC